MPTTPSTDEISRRGFLKTPAYLALGSATAGQLAAADTGKSGVVLVVAPDDAVASAAPPQWALSELKAALEGHGATERVVTKIADASAKELCVAAGGMSSPLAQNDSSSTQDVRSCRAGVAMPRAGRG